MCSCENAIVRGMRNKGINITLTVQRLATPSYTLHVLLCVYMSVCVRVFMRARSYKMSTTNQAHHELRGVDSKCPAVNVAFASHISSTLS